MSTSSSLSSAKRRRAGANDQSMSSNTVTNMVGDSVEESKHIMSVQDVLYMLNHKIEYLSTRVLQPNEINASSPVDNSDMLNQITDSIDNMNNTLEQFSEVIGEYDGRIKKIENALQNNSLELKIQQLEKRINEKILSKGTEKIDFLSKKKTSITTKELLAEKVPTKIGLTIDDKFAENEKKSQSLKDFEEQAATNDAENMKISFTGIKDKIEMNKDN